MRTRFKPSNQRSRNSAPRQNTGWQPASQWYNKIVGDGGHYYHEHVVLPKLKYLLHTNKDSILLDMGCGQGVLSRKLPNLKEYLGVDLSENLIEEAIRRNQVDNYQFIVGDSTQKLEIADNHYTHAVFVLSLQNMAEPEQALQHAIKAVKTGGTITIVLNHPAFRIPRQSGWGVDEHTKQQHRWINRYLSPLKIPITMNPGKQQSSVTWSFHRSISEYTQVLFKIGCVITGFEEWTSDKKSEGKAAKMENQARDEFPLFLAIQAKKV